MGLVAAITRLRSITAMRSANRSRTIRALRTTSTELGEPQGEGHGGRIWHLRTLCSWCELR
jgi:hypothetical protein